ncbi:MAG: hypothetical protein IJ837_03455 [Clostridia bacterium]|nr:hypothetical protein [Clostridia bacterium]
MSFGGAKVYFDGSHYIAIPHMTRPPIRKAFQKPDEVITVESPEGSSNDEPFGSCEKNISEEKIENVKNEEEKTQKSEKKYVKITKKEFFEQLYQKYIDLKKQKRKEKITEEMCYYFKTKEACVQFVEENFERKLRNLICRRVRMARKANLAGFNYFCTFTYDSNLHSEESFKKKLKYCFANFCRRKDWKYMGVWERSPEKKRLHFHGLFYIPKNGMVGELKTVRDFDTRSNKMRTTIQSTYFNERFGRSDFEEIDEQEKRLGSAIAYLMKYIEKTGEKIVYSKNLPQYFISDIMDWDIVCTIGQEDKKLLLFDDFDCWSEGVLIGKVSPEVIKELKKSN